MCQPVFLFQLVLYFYLLSLSHCRFLLEFVLKLSVYYVLRRSMVAVNRLRIPTVSVGEMYVFPTVAEAGIYFQYNIVYHNFDKKMTK